MAKKIAITGALGHIGSSLIHGLKRNDFDDVLLIDDMSSQRYCSLFNLPSGVPYRFVEADVFTADLEKLFAGMDVVIHLAAITDATSSFDKKDQVERVNFEATRKVAAACVATGAKLIFPSTTSVYGVQEQVVDEDCPLSDLKPQSPYAEAKLKSEQLLMEMVGLQFVILRLGTIFGVSPGMRFHTAVNKFIWQACVGQSLTVWKTAMNQVRPYLAVSDANRALRFVIQKGIFDRRIYNVLTTNATVGEIVEIIRGHIPDIEVKLVESRIMNQLSYHVSNKRFSAHGFEIKSNLKTDIAESINLLKNTRVSASRN